MKFPTYFDVKGKRYKIKAVNGMAENFGRLGTCSAKDALIEFDPKYPNNEVMLTLLHEIGHAIMCEVAIDQAISPELQEIITENFAQVLFSNFNIRFKNETKSKK